MPITRTPSILVWVEPRRKVVQGDARYMAYAMAEDGTPLGQMSVDSAEWAKANLGVTTTSRHDVYASEYPAGFEVLWLEDPHRDGRWWRAKFFEHHRWEITFVEFAEIPYVEFRDEASRQVQGYVAYLRSMDAYYVLSGRSTPRAHDLFPEPGMPLLDAMVEAELQFRSLL